MNRREREDQLLSDRVKNELSENQDPKGIGAPPCSAASLLESAANILRDSVQPGDGEHDTVSEWITDYETFLRQNGERTPTR